MGGNRRVSSYVPVGRETVHVQYGALLDAVLQGFPNVVAISHHLLPGQSTLAGLSSPTRRSRCRRNASLPATTALEALAEVRLVDLDDAFSTLGLVVAERFEDHISPAPKRSSGNSDFAELVQIVQGPVSGRQGLEKEGPPLRLAHARERRSRPSVEGASAPALGGRSTPKAMGASGVATVLVDLAVAAVGTLPDVPYRLVEVLDRIHSLATAAQRTNLLLLLGEFLGGQLIQQVENRGKLLTFHNQNGLADQ